MKKAFIIFVCALWILMLTYGFAHAVSGDTYTFREQRQEKLHGIAESARALGLPETDPIIVQAKALWERTEQANYTDEDIRILANVVYNEAGYGCSEEHMEMVAQVVLNRVASPKFPDTISEVVCQRNQYSPSYVSRTYPLQPIHYEIARRALEGEVLCDPTVLFQAQFKQGTGVFLECYSEMHNTTTYFCYG